MLLPKIIWFLKNTANIHTAYFLWKKKKIKVNVCCAFSVIWFMTKPPSLVYDCQSATAAAGVHCYVKGTV